MAGPKPTINSDNEGGKTINDDHDKHEKEIKQLFTCDKCNESFEYDFELKEHMDTINMCNICHIILNSNLNLIQHYETHAFMPRCEKCKLRFSIPTDLKNHEENVHKRSIEREPSLRTKPNKSKKGH